MEHIIIPVSSEADCSQVFKNNGFKRHDTMGKWFHESFKQAGIKTSPGNSECIYEKGGRLYLFNGWESDAQGRMIRNPKYIEALDVTDIVRV